MRSRLSDYPELILEKLLKRGADISVRNVRGETVLHTGISDSFESYEILFMEKAIRQGVDVNSENDDGQTALYTACERDLTNWVYFYLYHGANAVISSANNVLPLCMLSENCSSVANDLLDYTFFADRSEIYLRSIILSMSGCTELFEDICKRCQIVIYDVDDIYFFAENLRVFKAKNFELFIKYYGHIMEDIISQTQFLEIILDLGLHMVLSELKGILLAVLHSKYISLLVQQNRDLTFPIVTCLVKVFNSHEDMFFNKHEISEIVLLLLENGLTISLRDLDTVYKYYGYGDLLKILLHMDVINPKQEKTLEVDHSYEEPDVRDRQPLSSIIQLLYNPSMNIEDCWNDPPAYLDILKQFNNAKVKEQIAIDCQDVVLLERLQRMPQVPQLLELSRNATRKFIMKRYNIKKPCDFYTILKTLSLGPKYTRIIALEDCLY